ncbi:MAG: TIGR01777 family protein [Croceitalea sp.]|nr:TIGR01777 family protein [Croceitalea sp.]
MKVLITGATGLVGTAIVNELHKKGIQVNYLTTQKNKIKNDEDYQGFHWNPSKSVLDSECFKGVGAIINLAGASISERWTKSYKEKILNSRINSLRTLKKGLESIDTSKIKTFVTASATGIYPNSLINFYDEGETAIDDSFLGEVVHAWEQEADSFDTFNFQLAKIRIGLVLSTEGGALPKLALPIKNYLGAAMASGDQWQSWIHIDDLARMFVYVIFNELQGTFNGVAPNPVTNTKLTNELASVLGKKILLPNIPKAMLQLILGEMAYILWASQRVSSKKIEKSGFTFNHLNICRALEDLYQNNGGKRVHSDSFQKEFV